MYVNFVTARDGRVSFNVAGHLGGGDVSDFDANDVWLMAMLRARADAVMIGEGTLRSEPSHVWMYQHFHPDDDDLVALRSAECTREYALQVVVSLEGTLPEDAAMLQRREVDVVVATTTVGATRVPDGVETIVLGETEVDLRQLVRVLVDDYGVKRLLCEGGPRLYGSVLRARLPLDEFVTLSPLMLGEDESVRRPSLVEGAAWQPGATPRSRLLSVRRAGDYLFLRSRYPPTP
jgi:5-amino-6-(5-phosphoribosylamino)uracil reductase